MLPDNEEMIIAEQSVNNFISNSGNQCDNDNIIDDDGEVEKVINLNHKYDELVFDKLILQPE